MTATPPRHRFTRDDLAFLVRSGLLGEDGIELIDGDLIEKMPRGEPHVYCTRQVARALESHFGYAFVRAQEPIALGPRSEPEPDVAVTTRTDREYLIEGTPPAAEIRLLVEVSDTTREYDLGTKALLYAAAGIPEYWVIDVNERQLHRHTEPGSTGYRSVTVLKPDDSVPLGEAALSLSRLLP